MDLGPALGRLSGLVRKSRKKSPDGCGVQPPPPRTECLRGAAREGSLEEVRQCPEKFSQMGSLPSETRKQPLLAGPVGLTTERGVSPQFLPEAGGPWAWGKLCSSNSSERQVAAPEGLTLP